MAASFWARPSRRPASISAWTRRPCKRLLRAAAGVAPEIGQMRVHDAWAGLRPGSPDGLPILGPASLPGYFAATGHYRDGILLAPITAQLMTQLLTGQPLRFNIEAFSPLRFGKHKARPN